MPCPETKASTKARALLAAGNPSPGELRPLIRELKAESRFDLARRLLASARACGASDPWLLQQEALCTYKDMDLPASQALDRALRILAEGENLRTTTTQETLGIAGGIFKRKWEVDGQKGHLERALVYYRRGCERGIAGKDPAGEDLDEGYTAINTAFLLDRLASIEMREAAESGEHTDEVAETRRREASTIRETIVEELGKYLEDPERLNWWNVATMAEAHLGLGEYDEALSWLQQGTELENVESWERESTVRQLATLARLQMPDDTSPEEFERSDAGQMLKTFLASDYRGVMSAFIGKVGMALSGGGFRASFFHLGVLARLAELDVLRHVEVLSCVSGGSILGADYYLRVRDLLQRKRDVDITRQDYIDIVQAMTTDFLKGVERNIRTRAVLNPLKDLKMMRTAYTRSHRVGELYEREIYSRIRDGHGDGPRYMSDLLIHPQCEPADFVPKRDNWRRQAKVPILILNATCLNTGHNWQFTATWMGESPAAIEPEIDGVERLRRMYYCDAPKPHQKVRLGYAVAASACVPGLFAPLTLTKLYPNRVIRLVDGGVHDNQGEVGLLEQECAVGLVSDAGGQLLGSPAPKEGVVGVLGRSQGIQNARIREAQFKDLRARRMSGLLRGFMYVHLKRGLGSPPVNRIVTPGEAEEAEVGQPSDAAQDPVTSYKVNREIQGLVSGIRTDLDSFGEAEAHALMASGYRMTCEEFPRAIQEIPTPEPEDVRWDFLRVAEAMASKDPPAGLERVLRAGRSRAFKIWKLVPVLRAIGFLLGLAALAAAGYAIWHWRKTRLLQVEWIGLTVLGLLAVAMLGKVGREAVAFVRRRRFGVATAGVDTARDYLFRWAQAAALAVVGSVAAWIHLYIFDPWFKRRERVRRVLP